MPRLGRSALAGGEPGPVAETRMMRVELSEEDARRLRVLAVQRGETVQGIVGRLIREWLAEEEKRRA
jgi:hypothetical protein